MRKSTSGCTILNSQLKKLMDFLITTKKTSPKIEI